MLKTRRTSLTLDLTTLDQIAEVQTQFREATGARLSMARIVCAAVQQYRDRIVKATGAINNGEV